MRRMRGPGFAVGCDCFLPTDRFSSLETAYPVPARLSASAGGDKKNENYTALFPQQSLSSVAALRNQGAGHERRDIRRAAPASGYFAAPLAGISPTATRMVISIT